jgi:hypothetical protein
MILSIRASTTNATSAAREDALRPGGFVQFDSPTPVDSLMDFNHVGPAPPPDPNRGPLHLVATMDMNGPEGGPGPFNHGSPIANGTSPWIAKAQLLIYPTATPWSAVVTGLRWETDLCMDLLTWMTSSASISPGVALQPRSPQRTGPRKPAHVDIRQRTASAIGPIATAESLRGAFEAATRPPSGSTSGPPAVWYGLEDRHVDRMILPKHKKSMDLVLTDRFSLVNVFLSELEARAWISNSQLDPRNQQVLGPTSKTRTGDANKGKRSKGKRPTPDSPKDATVHHKPSSSESSGDSGSSSSSSRDSTKGRRARRSRKRGKGNKRSARTKSKGKAEKGRNVAAEPSATLLHPLWMTTALHPPTAILPKPPIETGNVMSARKRDERTSNQGPGSRQPTRQRSSGARLRPLETRSESLVWPSTGGRLLQQQDHPI